MLEPEGRPPQKLVEIPVHVRVWLASIEPSDIERFKKWDGFIIWAEQTGRFGRILVIGALAVFGTVVSVTQGWEWLTKFFGKG